MGRSGLIVALLLGAVVMGFMASSQLCAKPLNEYLPRASYDPAIPTPAQSLGFEVGERHIRHHELVAYMRALAAASDRVTIETFGETHGGRPQVMLTITSGANQERIESIRAAHVALTKPYENTDDNSDGVNTQSLPVVVSLGYSIHGNEPSGSNASVLVAYHLAAARDPGIAELLDDVVVLIDPSLNPDGFDRFAQWVNRYRGKVPNADANHMEHRESWPVGRTNYYLFDLNRDWLPAVHPASQGRLRQFHRWKPNVLADFHEMGTGSTYFFQPGVPQRNHPLTPKRTVDLTGRIARYHAQALDAAGVSYYSEERFDDFYYGKGSTYPDIHGAIGILFEQASSRGHLQENADGALPFWKTIHNQVITSFSTLNAAKDLRPQLLEHKERFYDDAKRMASESDTKGYVVASPHDPARLKAFTDVLALHDISFHRNSAMVKIDDREYEAGAAVVVPMAQAEHRFIEALFETRTEFEVSEFYDVSTWTLPLAFGLEYEATMDEAVVREPRQGTSATEQSTNGRLGHSDVGYLIDWRGAEAARVLYGLLDAEVKVKVAMRPLTAMVGGERMAFGYGTLLVPVGTQRDKAGKIREMLTQAMEAHHVKVYAVDTGVTPTGIDLGSDDMRALDKPRVMLLAGEGVSSYEAGEVWHLFDVRVGMPVSLVDVQGLSRVDLDDYDVIVAVSGRYDFGESTMDRMKDWQRSGGTLVTIGRAARWAMAAGLADGVEVGEDRAKEQGKTTPEQQMAQASDRDDEAGGVKRRPYANARQDAAVDLISGAIFEAEVDVTHPVGFGYEKDRIPVFRNHSLLLEPSPNPYATPLVYTHAPLKSGYISEKNLEKIKGSASVLISAQGRGRTVMLLDNPNFRGFWRGTNRLFLNSVFFGSMIDVPRAPDEEGDGHQHDDGED